MIRIIEALGLALGITLAGWIKKTHANDLTAGYNAARIILAQRMKPVPVEGSAVVYDAGRILLAEEVEKVPAEDSKEFKNLVLEWARFIRDHEPGTGYDEQESDGYNFGPTWAKFSKQFRIDTLVYKVKHWKETHHDTYVRWLKEAGISFE